MLLVSALVFGLAAQQACAARAAQDRARSRVAEARGDVTALRERLRRLEARSGADDAAIGRALAAAAAPPPRVLADVVALLPGDVRLDGLSLSYGERIELDLQVVARRARDYDLFLERLTASPRFEAVLPGPERREGEVRANVRAAYSASEGEP